MRAKDFSHENTICSFVLHSKILYDQKEPSKSFRQYLLKEAKILNVIEMSSVRKLVFKNAVAPAAIVTFKYNGNTDNLQNRINYISMKPNMFFKLFNIIVVEKYDVKYVPQSLLFENDWAWKTIVYGFSKDIEVIALLKIKFDSIQDELKKNSDVIYGAGIQDHLGEKKDSKHLIGRPLLDTDTGIDHFKVNLCSSILFEKSNIHRPRKQKLFEPPYCITLKGLDLSNYKMRSAYTEELLVCKETAYIIKGTLLNKQLLLNLTGLLNSSFYAYLMLMTGSSLGIEREQRFMKEVLSFPYVSSKQISAQAESISNCINAENQDMANDIFDNSIETEIEKLDRLILVKFDLQDNLFIDYAINIQIPELTNSKEINIYRAVTSDELREYAKCFINQFTSIYNKVKKGIRVKLYPQVLKRYVVFELEITENLQNVETIINNVPNDNMELFKRIIRHDYNEMFHQIRDVIHFTENSFYIIKPNNYKYWHPAIAEMDLTDVLDQILSDDGGEE